MGAGQTVVIVGAGIGGLTTALAVARAGFAVVICERAAELTEIGAGIQLSPNAGRILAGLGLDDAIAAAAIEPPAIDVRNGVSGAMIVSIPVAMFRERYGFPYRVIHRADLQAVLVAAVRKTADIKLMLGATIADVLPRGRELLVKLRGKRNELVRAVAIVGADGVWSTTRERITGALDAEPTGRTAWRTVIPYDNAPETLAADRVGLWVGQSAHLVHYPIARGAAINVVAIVEEQWDKQGWNARGDYRRIAERFNTWSAEVRAIVTAPQSWQKWAINAVDPTGSWSEGATTLLGDAAHAMTPFLAQGAAMAIEDAAVLADCLAASPGNAAAALAAYEAERKPRVARVWNAAKRTGERYHFAAPLAGIRDLALRLIGPRLVLAQNDWIYRWQRPGESSGASNVGQRSRA
jgi:2-polyprenyl-6-methoxyphenol hydroxylase-like FAD-dependent oxidoreductase